MSTSFKHKALNVLLVLLGPSLVFLGTLIPKRHEFIGLAVEHLGVGVFAVTLLKLTLEAATQKEFLRILGTDIKSQVMASVASLITRSAWILDDQVLKEELKNSVLLPDFVRPFYNLTLRLEPLRGSRSRLLRAWIRIHYQVHNVSGGDKSYVVGAWLDDIIRLDDPGTETKPGFTKVTIGPEDHKIVDLIERGKTRAAGKAGAIYFEDHMIQLRELSTPPIKAKETLEITVEGMQIMQMEDHFVWNLPTITHKLSFSIVLAGGLTFDQLDLSPVEMHHMSHEEFMNTLVRTDNTMTLEIKHVLLPFQGVELRWAPKRGQAASNTPPPAIS